MVARTVGTVQSQTIASAGADTVIVANTTVGTDHQHLLAVDYTITGTLTTPGQVTVYAVRTAAGADPVIHQVAITQLTGSDSFTIPIHPAIAFYRVEVGSNVGGSVAWDIYVSEADYSPN